MVRSSVLKILIVLLFVSYAHNPAYSQKSNDVFAAPYNRIGLTPIFFVNNKLDFAYSLKPAFRNLELPSKFDNNSISSDILTVNLPTAQFPKRQDNKRESENKGQEQTRSLGEELGRQLLEMSARKIQSELAKQAFKKLNNTLYDSLVRKYIESARLPHQIIDTLYSADPSGRYAMDRLIKRAKYNLTDAQAQELKATAKGFEGSVRDIQWANKILTSNYILALHFHDIRRINPDADKKSGSSIEKMFNGYEAMVTASFYRLDLNDSVRSAFYNKCWAGASSTEEELAQAKKARRNMNYPLEKVRTYPFTITSRQVSSGGSNRKELFQKLPQKALQEAIHSIEKDVASFKVRTSIFDYNFSFASNARAKIGTKEGLKPDMRYFVYEYVADDSGNVKQKRRGVLRSTADISQNDTIATGNMKPSRFLQTGGSRLGKGMLIEQKPDWGIALSAGYMNQGNSFLNFRLDLRISKTLNIPPSWHLYGEYAIDVTQITGFDQETVSLTEDVKNNGDPETDVTIRTYGGGISKEFYFLNNLQFVPYAGFRAEKAMFDDDELHEFLDEELGNGYAQRKWMIDAGARLGINIAPWLKLRGTFGYSPIPFDAEESFFGEEVNKDMADELSDYEEGDANPFHLPRTPYKWDVMMRINF